MTWRATSARPIARHVIQQNMPGHVMGCPLIPETRVQSALDDVASNMRQTRYYSPRHRVPFHSSDEGSKLGA
jgi:hypothetical protein